MTHQDHLIEQHIRLHESHLKHIDEMLHRAHEHVEAGSVPPAVKVELKDLEEKRDELAGELAEMKRAEPQHWQRDALSWSGPMGIWDTVAQRLEKLVERLD